MNQNNQNESIRLAAQRIVQDANADLGLSTIAKLTAAGYIAYFAGGCVRDALLGKTPKDYDVATNARPEQIRELFGHRRTLAIGAAFGVITVLGPKNGLCKPVEVATFRSDGQYSDGRHPDSVQFSSPEQDALRRDFTINGMFFDPGQCRVIDYVGGLEDLVAGFIRAIREPDERFQEDKLRLLRAVRFAATFGFQLEPRTLEAVTRRAAEVTTCSGERIGAEMLRILSGSHTDVGLRLLHTTKLAAAIMPKIALATAESEILDRACRLLNHYTDRPNSDGFAARLALLILSDRQQQAEKEMAAERLAEVVGKWHLSNDQRDATLLAIQDVDQLLIADQLKWSQLQPLLIKRFRDTSVQVAKAIAVSNPGYAAAVESLERALSLTPDVLDPNPLLTGNDLIEMGLKPGPKFKQILHSVRAAQLDGEIATVEQASQLVNAKLG